MPVKLSPYNNVPKRILIREALLDYARMLNVSQADIEILYRRVEELNTQTYESDKNLSFVDKHNVEALVPDNKTDEEKRVILKERLEQMKGQICDKIFAYYGLNTNEDNIPVIAKILSEANITKSEAELLAKAVCSKKLEEPYKQERLADRLCKQVYNNRKSLKTKLAEDFQTYETALPKNDFIEQIREDVLVHIGAKSATEAVLRYSTRNEEIPFRRQIRDDFNKPDGSRDSFLKLYAMLALNGMNLLQNKDRAVSNYGTFMELIKHNYPDNWQEVADRALGVRTSETDAKAREALRQKKYQDKSREVYIKTMAGILTNKMVADKKYHRPEPDYAGYVRNVENRFLKDMRRGFLNIDSLLIENTEVEGQDSDSEYDLYKKRHEKTQRSRCVAVDHKRPVASAYDLVDRFLGAQKSKQDQLKKACDCVNQIGNHRLIVGQGGKLHDEFESNGTYILSANRDTSFFLSEFDPKICDKNIPTYLRPELEALAKATGSQRVIGVNMDFPDWPVIEDERKKLKSADNDIRIDQKYERYYERA